MNDVFTPIERRLLARVARALLLRQKIEAAADAGMDVLANELARAMNADELAIVDFLNRRMLLLLAQEAAGRGACAAPFIH
jgi:hypothetical protein